MNKKWFPHIIALGAFIVFIVLGLACASTSRIARADYVFDSSIPLEESSKILFFLYPNTYNDIPIKEAYPQCKSLMATIPAGEAEFEYNTTIFRDYRGFNSTITKYAIIKPLFKYNFEPGKEYTVTQFWEKKAKIRGQPQEYKYYVNIYDSILTDYDGYYDEKSLVKFEPYLLASIFIIDTEDVAFED